MKKKGEKKRNLGGRPTNYKREYNQMAYVACVEGGFTDAKLAKLFSVTEQTINNWKRAHKKFFESIQKGKDEFNSLEAEKSLFKLVRGFRYTVTTKEARPVISKDTDGNKVVIGEKLMVTKEVSKYYPPNDRALRFFLKNRDPARWRDTQAVEVTGNDGGPIKQQLTNFPSGPLTLAEWEKQVKELNEQKEDSTDDSNKPNDVLSTLNIT